MRGLTMLVSMFTWAAFAQVDTANIVGTLKDASGAVVPGAKVKFVRDSTGIEVSTTAGASGEYVSPPLRPGAFAVRAEAAGFRTAVGKVTLELNQRAVLDFTMEVGAVSETVNVEASATLLESETVTVGSLQNERALANLPLNTRNFNQLLGLSTGVMPAQTQAGNLAITAARGTTANVVNGIGFRSNNYRVDGVDNSENHNGQGIMLYPPVEAIQEFRIQTSVPSAEFGRGGGTINVAYKSGGRDFHGNLFEFLRNSALDAKNYFDRPAAPIAPFHMNQFGGTIGGPVLLPHYGRARSKTFFFFSWEAERRVQGVSSLSTVPLPAFKSGDFSASAFRLFEPLTSQLVNGQIQRAQFPGNTMPASRLDKTGANLIGLYPDPNLPGQVANYGSNPNQTVNRDNYDVKIDRSFGERDQAFFRDSQHATQQYLPGPLPLPAIGAQDASNNSYPLKQFVAAYTRAISPTLVNEFRAAATRLNILALQLNHGANLADEMGIPGVNSGSDARAGGLPFINLSGYPSLGDSGFRPAIISMNNYQLNDIVSWTKNKHSFRLGGEAIRRQRNKLQSSALHGILNFGPIYSTNPAAPSGTGLSLADMLLGAPASGNIAYLTGTVGQRRTDYAGFLQDTWRVSQSFTLTLGLRYDYFSAYPSSEVGNRMAYFQPVANGGGVFDVGSSQLPWASGVKPDRNNIGPRVGVAYKLGAHTVIRSGFGTMYSPDPGLTLGDGNPPFAGSVAFANDQGDFNGARRTSQGFARPAGVVFSPLGAALIGIDANLATPYANQWNFTLERMAPGDILITAGYVGTSGKKLLLAPNLNQARPGPGTVAARRPFPLYSDITWDESSNSSVYNSLQLSAEKRLAHGVQFLASYTWSHGFDSGDFVGGRQDFRNLAAGRGRQFAQHLPRALDLVAGGWQLNTILSLYSGLPFTPASAVNTLNGSGGQRPDRTGNGNLDPADRTTSRWFDLSAFRTPGLYQFGNAGRNILVGPGTKQMDLALAKSFRLTERTPRSLEFRAEMFNVSNTPQFNNPNASIGGAGRGHHHLCGLAAELPANLTADSDGDEVLLLSAAIMALSRRQFLNAGAFGGLAAGRPAGRAKRPNIVFLLLDDAGWRDLACFGNTFHDTPNLDRLSSEGVKFTNAYAACPVCSPTRASILTGKYPARLGLTDWIPGLNLPAEKLSTPAVQRELALREVTVAEALKPLGYRTASIGKWHLGGPEFGPENQGFDLNAGGTFRGHPESYFGPFDLPNLLGNGKGDYLTEKLTEAAESFIRESAGKSPFFLYLSEFAVHRPLEARRAAIEKYMRKSGGKDFPNPVYAAMVESVDIALGRIRALLDRLKISKDTILIVTSDNGGVRYPLTTDNGPLRAGKGHLYEGGVREPLIVYWPGVTSPGRVEDYPVSSADYFPTIVEMAGGVARRDVDGVSIAGLLGGKRAPRRDALFWHYPHYGPNGGVPSGAVRNGDWKLIEFFEDGRLELFNLRDDIGERRNLVLKEPGKREELHARLKRWRSEVRAAMPTVNPKHDPARKSPGFDGREPPTAPA